MSHSIAVPFDGEPEKPQYAIQLKLNVHGLIRGFALVETVATVARHVFETPLPGDSSVKLAAWLFWGIVILVESDAQIADGKSNWIWQMLSFVARVLEMCLTFIVGAIRRAGYVLKKAAIDFVKDSGIFVGDLRRAFRNWGALEAVVVVSEPKHGPTPTPAAGPIEIFALKAMMRSKTQEFRSKRASLRPAHPARSTRPIRNHLRAQRI